MDVKTTLAQNIKRLRKGVYTQAELASKIGVSHSVIRSYENELAYPPADRLEVLAKELKVEPYELLKPYTDNCNGSSNYLLLEKKLFEKLEGFEQSIKAVKEHQQSNVDDHKDTEYYAPSLERNLTLKEFKHVLYLDSLVYSFKTSREFIKTLSPEDNELWRASINAINDRFGYYRYTALRDHLKKHDAQFREGPPWWHDMKDIINQDETDEAKKLA